MKFIRGLEDYAIASQIAELLNTHNRLATRRSPEDILRSQTQYVVELHGKLLLGVCGFEDQSRVFTEIKHLVVKPQYRGKHIGRFLVKRALALAKCPMSYATIRTDNDGSLGLFRSLDFLEAGTYPSGDHRVAILLKVNEGWKRSFSSHSNP